jgi:hypothetical protein
MRPWSILGGVTVTDDGRIAVVKALLEERGSLPETLAAALIAVTVPASHPEEAA